MHVQGSAHCDGLDPRGGERGVLIHHGDGRQVRRRPGIEPSDPLVLPGEITDCAGIAVTTLARADGEGHRLEAHHAEDNRREEVFERHNLTVVRVTVSDHARPVDTGARIRAAQRSGMRRDRRYDSWSLAKCSGHRVVDTTEPYRSTVGLTA